MNNCDLIFTLNSHKDAVFCVDMQNDLIATGSCDKVYVFLRKTMRKNK